MKSFALTRSDDDYGTKEADFRVRQPELVHPLSQAKHGIHQEPGVPRRHVSYRVLADQVSVQANQSLSRQNQEGQFSKIILFY